MQKTKLKKTAIVSLAEQIIEDSSKAMSTQDIVAKFNPLFPFQIKCVISAHREKVGDVITVLKPTIPGDTCTCGMITDISSIPGYLYRGSAYEDDYSCDKCIETFVEGRLKMWVLI